MRVPTVAIQASIWPALWPAAVQEWTRRVGARWGAVAASLPHSRNRSQLQRYLLSSTANLIRFSLSPLVFYPVAPSLPRIAPKHWYALRRCLDLHPAQTCPPGDLTCCPCSTCAGNAAVNHISHHSLTRHRQLPAPCIRTWYYCPRSVPTYVMQMPCTYPQRPYTAPSLSCHNLPTCRRERTALHLYVAYRTPNHLG